MMDLATIKKNKFNKEGIFFTSLDYAKILKEKIYEMMGGKKLLEVLDITCGAGNLLKVFNDEVKKYGVELNYNFVEEARKIPNSEIYEWDIIKNGGVQCLNKLFDAQIFNYPFSIKNKSKERVTIGGETYEIALSVKDMFFLFLIISRMSPTGVAVGISSSGAFYRSSEKKYREILLDLNVIESIELVNKKDVFVDTQISFSLVTMRNNKQDKNITFIIGENKKTISHDEIRKNDFSFSPSFYVEDPNNVQKVWNKEEILTLDKIADLYYKKLKKMILEYDIYLAMREIEENPMVEKEDFLNNLISICQEELEK